MKICFWLWFGVPPSRFGVPPLLCGGAVLVLSSAGRVRAGRSAGCFLSSSRGVLLMALPFSFVAAPVAVPSASSSVVPSGFVPAASEVSLRGAPASAVVCRSRLGGVVLSSASLSGGVLTVVLADAFPASAGTRFRCLLSCFGGSAPEALLASVRSAVSSGSPVWLWCAVGSSGYAASGFFCGLSFSAPDAAPVAPVPGVCSGF